MSDPNLPKSDQADVPVPQDDVVAFTQQPPRPLYPSAWREQLCLEDDRDGLERAFDRGPWSPPDEP